MKHFESSRAWRPVRSHAAPGATLGAWLALLFNICLVALPVTAAASFYVISRDQLYAYELSSAGQRNVSARVERLAGELILLDFDRTRQWDDLVAMELMNGDVPAARGFLLSGRRMLSAREANQIDRRVRAESNDAEVELAALELLTPGTRARYESLVPLLSRRSASGAVQPRAPEQFSVLGDQRDFELLARAMLSDAEADPLHFVLTGLGLGLGGDFTPRMQAGASALLVAERRQDFPNDFAEEITALVHSAAPTARFRSAALRQEHGADAGAYANAAAAFRASIIPDRLAAVKTAFDEIGMMSEATSVAGASVILTHAHALRDVPRLRLVAQAAGDRAVAVAKGLPRDGRLARSARGELTLNPQLTLLLSLTAAAFAGAILLALYAAYLGLKGVFDRHGFGFRADEDEDEPEGGELVHTFSEPNGRFRPL